MKLKLKDIESNIRNMDTEAALQYLLELKSTCPLSLDKLIEKHMRKKLAYDKEKERYFGMYEFERQAYTEGYRLVAGSDEAGRGPLAGPVVAAAVILPKDIFIEGLNDSKQLSPVKRDLLYEIIREKALTYGIGIVDEKCIDEINIKNAAIKAMELAVQDLKPQPDMLLVDAEKLVNTGIRQKSIIKGDCLSVSIAAASIIAKVTRDRMLDELDKQYPQYGFFKHKGYGTKEHIEAIKKYGICPIHRISFTKNFVD